MLDVFQSDAFGVVSLTDAINKVKFVPGRIGQLGLFAETGVATTSVAIEERDGVLSLISPTPRGGPGETLDKAKRKLRSFSVPHFEIDDAIMAEEVQGVRAWGSETEVEMVQSRVMERFAIHAQSLEATREYARIGAVKGLITYADGTTLDLFDQFDVSQLAEVDFDLDNASPAEGALRRKVAEVFRIIAEELGGTPFTGMHALCGDAFYDDLIAHPEVRATYIGWNGAQELRQGYVQGGLSYGAFPFGGIMWENYRGSVGGTNFVHTDKCHIFPTGVMGLFRTYFAPADWVETVNTIGQAMYAKQYEMLNGKGVHLDSQSNMLSLSTRPRVLQQGRRT